MIVMKFGGAAVETPAALTFVAERVAKRAEQDGPVVVVVSAMGDTTDHLLSLAHEVNPHPPQRELDMLVSVGERISMALLAMALDKLGVEAVSFTGSQAGILTTPEHADAKILSINPKRLWAHLEAKRIVIVAGFQGMSTMGDITTLGRGGSDTTAVGLGVAFKAQLVEFYKDVPGIFDKDPKQHHDARLFPHLSYAEAYDLCHGGAQILQPRCLRLAEKNNIPLRVLPFAPVAEGLEQGTWIGFENTEAVRGEGVYEG